MTDLVVQLDKQRDSGMRKRKSHQQEGEFREILKRPRKPKAWGIETKTVIVDSRNLKTWSVGDVRLGDCCPTKTSMTLVEPLSAPALHIVMAARDE